MNEDIILRLFTEKDLDDVVAVNRAALPENYASYFFMEIYYKHPHGFWVAEDKKTGSIIGYCMWRVEKSFSHFSSFLKRVKIAHLISIAVLEKFRRRNIGEQLLLSGMNSMKQFYQVQEYYLEVRITNFKAIKMYEKHNFKKLKVIKGYYKDGENAYLMAYKL
ncbi:MAG: GNAT family N-acetyltransferase [Candidatus Helarchaeota archaeon]